MKKNSRALVLIVIWILTLLIGMPILKDNYVYFIKIYTVLLAIGIVSYPITRCIFKKDFSNGWIFSKIIGIVTPAILMWLLSYFKILKYTNLNAIIILGAFALINVFIFCKNKQYKSLETDKLQNIIMVECIFAIIFISWTLIRSYNVQITHNVEQYMNYGFINKLLNTDYFPAEDIWLSGNSINYYYYGQYIISFIGKLTFLDAKHLYNIIMSLISTFTFIMPFSIAFNLGLGIKIDNKKLQKILPFILAILTGATICYGGGLHYVLYNNNDDFYYANITRYNSYEKRDANGNVIIDKSETTATDIPAYSNLVRRFACSLRKFNVYIYSDCNIIRNFKI